MIIKSNKNKFCDGINETKLIKKSQIVLFQPKKYHINSSGMT